MVLFVDPPLRPGLYAKRSSPWVPGLHRVLGIHQQQHQEGGTAKPFSLMLGNNHPQECQEGGTKKLDYLSIPLKGGGPTRTHYRFIIK